MMSEVKVLETLEKYRLGTQDPDLQCALSVVLDWRASAAYYESEARCLRAENNRLRDRVDELTADIDRHRECSCGGV